MSNPKKFLLVGQASHGNRGNEAIVRGTMHILREEFGPNTNADLGVRVAKDQLTDEMPLGDPGVTLFSNSNHGAYLSRKWWAMKANRFLGTSFKPHTWDFAPYLNEASAALQVGGDCYSLDYGLPEIFMEIDDSLLACGVPVVLWGATVGPFDRNPEFAERMFEHLRRLTAIFVREDESLNYLRENGVADNVHRTCDPAFVMEPQTPEEGKLAFPFPQGAIGLNLSTLAGDFREHGNSSNAGEAGSSDWDEMCVEMVRAVALLGRPLVLIPHVEMRRATSDDFRLLAKVKSLLVDSVEVPIHVLPPTLNASELKWAIGQCDVFAGARTHSTIAAFAMLVPTLSLAYSMKAWGINRDIFGHTDHVVPVSDITPGLLAERIEQLLDDKDTIRAQLSTKLPQVKEQALNAGKLLRAYCRS